RPTAPSSAAVPAPQAFPPSVKRCLGKPTNRRKHKIHRCCIFSEESSKTPANSVISGILKISLHSFSRDQIENPIEPDAKSATRTGRAFA
ncbi:hypothetical protein, partial [Paracoccus sp. SM22M-07]|uniref:hypothetical protein n=1 Tax=Paracoccus sp. SM22M-07 TaxID=1520813 RepID=UPI00197D52AA